MPNDPVAGRVEAVIKNFLKEHFDISPDQLSKDSRLRDVGLDSIMMLDVMLDVEDQLGVKLTDLSMPANPTLSDVVAVIERNMAPIADRV